MHLFHSIHNFRDFGGQKTASGKIVKKGMLYRCGTLANASKKDGEMLRELGIKTIVDLRTHKEVEKRPDRLPPDSGMNYIHIPIKVKQHNESGRIIQLYSLLFGEFKNIDYHEVLKEANREFALDFQPEFSRVLELISDAANLPVLIHCTGGKDRTGFSCSLILHALGVSHQDVLTDYTETNHHTAFLLEEGRKLLRFFKIFGIREEQFLPLLEAHPDFLGAAYEVIDRDFGGVDQYIANTLGFNRNKIAALENLLLQS